MDHSPPRNHHYIPQCLLKRFASKSGMLWEYNTNAQTIFPRHKSKTGFKEDLYARNLESAAPDFATIEKRVLGAIESPGSTALDMIEAGKPLKAHHFKAFITFIAFLHHRTPAFLQYIYDLSAPTMAESFRRAAKYSEEFHEHVRESFRESGKSEEEIADVIASLTRGEWRATPSKEHVLALALTSARITKKEFARMNWRFVRVPDGAPDLVLGDHPLTFLDTSGNEPQNLGIANRDIQIALPISSRMVAIADWQPGNPQLYTTLPKGATWEINDRTFRFAKQFLFSHLENKAIMGRALELKGTGPRVRVTGVPLPNGGLAHVSEWYQP